MSWAVIEEVKTEGNNPPHLHSLGLRCGPLPSTLATLPHCGKTRVPYLWMRSQAIPEPPHQQRPWEMDHWENTMHLKPRGHLVGVQLQRMCLSQMPVVEDQPVHEVGHVEARGITHPVE